MDELVGQVLVESVRNGVRQIEKRRESLDLVGTSHCLYPLIHQCLRDHADARPTALGLNRKMKELSTAEPKGLLDVAKLCNVRRLLRLHFNYIKILLGNFANVNNKHFKYLHSV